MSKNKNAVAFSHHSLPAAKWSESAQNGDHVPGEVARFRTNLVMLDLPPQEIEEAIDTTQQDCRRWDGMGSPHFTSPYQIDGFHAYLVECDPDLDLASTCSDARRRLARKISSRRKWADLAGRTSGDGRFSHAFKHYDEGLDALWPAPGSAGFRDFIEESSLAFRNQLVDDLIPLGRDGVGIRAYETDKRDYLNYSSTTAIEDSLSLLRTKLLLACQAEASIYNVEMEAVYFSVSHGDSASSLSLLAFFSDLWWSRGNPRLKSSDDVEAFIAFGLLKRWLVQVDAGEPVPEPIQRYSRTIRRFCEALMARAIRPITGFARELAAYHPLFEEDDYYADARGYYEYLLEASMRFATDDSDDILQF